MSNFLKIIGNQIRNIRKQKGLTQEMVANKTGLQDSYIGGIERGERNISLETLEKLLIGLEISPNVLFQFHNLDLVQQKRKSDVLAELNFYLESMNEEQIVLISKIVKEISDYTNKNINNKK